MDWFSRNRSALLTLTLCTAVVSTPSWAERAREDRHGPGATRMHGGGGWEREGRSAAGSAQRWDADVTRTDDGRLEGTVTLAGSPLAPRGTLHGTIHGQRVIGRIEDATGTPVADFAGVVGADGGLRGTYQDRTGEVGRWSWDGPLPQ